MKTPTVIQLHVSSEDQRIAALAALAIAIHVVEASLPSPVPGIKPGLANVITLVVLLLYGWRAAAWVALLRVVAGSLLLGTFLTPTFLLSLAGATASLAILGLALGLHRHLPGQGLGPVSFSLLAAMAHMAGQVLIARWLLIPHDGLFQLLPILMTAAVIFGTVTGLIVQAMLEHIRAAANDESGIRLRDSL